MCRMPWACLGFRRRVAWLTLFDKAEALVLCNGHQWTFQFILDGDFQGIQPLDSEPRSIICPAQFSGTCLAQHW